MSVVTISPSRLEQLRAEGRSIELIDVRTPVEFREIHVDFARNVPLTDLDPAKLLNGRNPQEPIYLICRSGSRGKMACDKLIAAGFANVVNVEGGTQAWADAGLPVVRGKKAISLERQVRIAAGFLVLTGVLLAWFVDAAFVWLSGFIGAGLIFAGVTDTCGMGMLIARMPWNRVKSAAPSCQVSPQSGG